MGYRKTSFMILLLLYAASACGPNPPAAREPSLEEQVRALEVEQNREAKANADAPVVERPIRSSFTEGFEPWERWPADRNHSFDLAPIMLYIGSDPEMDSLLDIR